jgi:hypothetical protein
MMAHSGNTPVRNDRARCEGNGAGRRATTRGFLLASGKAAAAEEHGYRLHKRARPVPEHARRCLNFRERTALHFGGLGGCAHSIAVKGLS